MKNIKKIVKWVLVGMSVAFAVLWAVPAQGVTDNHTVTFDNSPAIQLTLSDTSYDFGAISPASAAQADNAISVTVKSNSNYSLKVKGDANFVSGLNSIPIGRLQWATDSANWTTMTTSDVNVATGTQTDEDGDTYGMDYKIQLNWGDAVANDYSATITYTATNP